MKGQSIRRIVLMLAALALLEVFASPAVAVVMDGPELLKQRHQQGHSAEIGDEDTRIPGQYIVVLEDSVKGPASVAHAQTEQRNGKLGLVFRHAVKGYSAKLSRVAVEALRRDPRVKYVVPDREVEALAQSTPTGVKRIAATNNASLDIDGIDDVRIGVDVAVLDTGIDQEHPDLNVVGRTNCVPGKVNGALKQPAGVAIDPEGDVWVADEQNDRIQEFDAAGEYLSQFGASGATAGQLNRPHDLAIGAEGEIWVADRHNHRVQAFNAAGELLQAFGTQGSGSGQFSFPTDVAIDAEGNVWVADSENHRVQKFNSGGEYLSQFGGKGVGNGQLGRPFGIAIDAEGDIWVAENENHRVQQFNSQGEHLSKFGTLGSGNGQFVRPGDVAIDTEDNVLVADALNNRVQKFDQEGEYLTQFGEMGEGPGQFGSFFDGPGGLAVDPEGFIFVTDPAHNRVQKFSAGSPPSFSLAFGYPGCADGTGTDDHGHGTHVAGTIGAIDNAEGVVGVAPGARLWAVKVLNQAGSGMQSWLVGGIDWVTETREDADPENDIEVANMSLGGFDTMPALDAAIAASVEEGVVYVVAAGNDDVDANLVSPANHADVITVSALADYDGEAGGEAKPLTQLSEGQCEEKATEEWQHFGPDDALASFSNWGEDVEVAAPGVCVNSTLPGGEYGSFNGTSMASPHVAGAAAILASDSSPLSKGDVEAIRDELTDGGSLDWTATRLGDGGPAPLLYVGDAPLDTEVAVVPASPGVTAVTLRGAINARGLPTKYHFDYGTTTAYGQSVGGELAGGSKYVRVKKQLEDLLPGTRYHFRFVATNSEGTFKTKDRTLRTHLLAPSFSSALGKGSLADGQFNGVLAVAVDAQGDVWVTDGRVQQFNSSGEYLSKFGGEGSGFAASDIAIDAEGDIWIVDQPNDRVQQFKPNGENLSKFGTRGFGNGQFIHATGIAIDAEGDIWVVDQGNNRVQQFKSNGEYLNQFGVEGSANGQLLNPQDVAIDAEGDIWITDQTNDRVQQFTPNGGYLSKFGVTGSGNGQLSRPDGISVDSQGDIWIVDHLNSRVQQFTPNGEFLSQFGEFGTGNAQFWQPRRIAIDAEGDLWVGDSGNHRVQQISANGEYLGKFGSKAGAANGQVNVPLDVALDAEGDVWVTDADNHRVQQFKANGEYMSQFGTKGWGNGQFMRPHGIAVDVQGDVWVTDIDSHRVQQFKPNGEFLGKFGANGTEAGQFNEPKGIAIDPQGDVWVTDFLNHRVQQLKPSGEFLSQVGAPGEFEGFADDELYLPYDIAIDGKGEVWVTDSGNHRVQRFNSEGEHLGQVGKPGFDDGWFFTPAGVAIDGNGDVWVTEAGNPRVQRFNSEGEYLSQFGDEGLGDGQFFNPLGIAIDDQGGVWIADGVLKKWIVPHDKPTSTTKAATGVNAKAASLQGGINPNGLATKYRFEYGTSIEYGKTVPVPSKGVGSGNEAVEVKEMVEGLEPSTTYHFRVVAANDAGTTFGEDQEFTTVAAAGVFLQSGSFRAESYPASLTGIQDPADRHAMAVPGGRTIRCARVDFAGEQGGPSAALAFDAEYTGCAAEVSEVKLPTEIAMNSCGYEVAAAGALDVGCAVTGDAIMVTLFYDEAKQKEEVPFCTYKVAAQSGLGGVSFANFGTGASRGVTVDFSVANLSYQKTQGLIIHCGGNTVKTTSYGGSTTVTGSSG